MSRVMRRDDREMKSTRRRFLAFATVFAAFASVLVTVGRVPSVLAGTPAPVASGSTEKLELIVLVGAKTGQASIPPGFPQLAQAPFTIYNTYSVLSTETLTLPMGTTQRHTFVNGATLDATLVAPKSSPKVTVELLFNDAKGALIFKERWTAPRGERLLRTSMGYKSGNLVPALRVL